MKCMVVDVTKCIGCHNCQIACKDEHVGNDWPPYTKPQPEGHFWMKVKEIERGTAPKIRMDWIPKLCMHCEDAPCLKACPNSAIRKRKDGIVLIDPAKCKGSKKCLDACPYGAIYFNGELNVSQKCTMCAHLIDKGWKEPRCVTACPVDALTFGGKEELKDLIARAETLSPEDGKRPAPIVNVHYIGIPRKFIAGEVYCPTKDKCIEGALISLSNTTTAEKLTTKTDNYGDFWLDGLKEGLYSLVIEKEGYYPKEIKSIVTKCDVNLGSIKLFERS
jgi:tetrathionate reductase subunit B